jgi:hypothetical protein
MDTERGAVSGVASITGRQSFSRMPRFARRQWINRVGLKNPVSPRGNALWGTIMTMAGTCRVPNKSGTLSHLKRGTKSSATRGAGTAALWYPDCGLSRVFGGLRYRVAGAMRHLPRHGGAGRWGLTCPGCGGGPSAVSFQYANSEVPRGRVCIKQGSPQGHKTRDSRMCSGTMNRGVRQWLPPTNSSS